MFIMKNNVLEAEAMSNEDASFPKENCVDDQPARIAKSTASITEIIFSATNISDFAMFNISAADGGLKILDHDLPGNKVFTGTDVYISDNETIESTTTDLEGLEADDIVTMYGWENDDNNGTFEVAADSTTNEIKLKNNPLSVSIAGRNITIARFNDDDLSVDEDINFSFCKTWTDYFSGNAILLSKYYKSFENIVNATVKVSLAGTLPSVGICYGGRMRTYGTTQYGQTDEQRDNSIYRESANGSLNQVVRPVNDDAVVPVSASRTEAEALKQLFTSDNDKFLVFLLKKDEADGLQSTLLRYGKAKMKPAISWELPNRKLYSIMITEVGGKKS